MCKHSKAKFQVSEIVTLKTNGQGTKIMYFVDHVCHECGVKVCIQKVIMDAWNIEIVRTLREEAIKFYE